MPLLFLLDYLVFFPRNDISINITPISSKLGKKVPYAKRPIHCLLIFDWCPWGTKGATLAHLVHISVVYIR